MIVVVNFFRYTMQLARVQYFGVYHTLLMSALYQTHAVWILEQRKLESASGKFTLPSTAPFWEIEIVG